MIDNTATYKCVCGYSAVSDDLESLKSSIFQHQTTCNVEDTITCTT